MASKKFRNLNVEFRDIMGLSVSQRLDMLRSEEGQGILAGFTPAQLVDMFPRYYSERLPSVGKSLSRVSGGKVGEETIQTAQRETIQRKPVGGISGTPTTLPNVGNTRVRSGAPESQQPSWMKKLEPIVPGISDPGARAQLSREHKDVIEQMKKGTISADDPRVGFLKEISDADLRKYGIEKTDQGYKASSVQVSREEIETARKSTISGNSNQEIIMKSFASELRKKGVPEANIPYAVAALGGQVQQESGFNPRTEHDRGTGYGIYGARDPKPGQGRRTDMFKWLEQNGYARDSAEGQARYMVHEAFSGQYSATRKALLSANKDNIGQVTAVLVNDFEKPQERRQNIIDRTQNSNNLLGQALRIGSNVDVSSNMTDEQIAQTIREKKEKERESGLAGAVASKYKLPDGIDANFRAEFDRFSPGQKQKFIEALSQRGDNGVTQFNEWYKTNRSQEPTGTPTQQQPVSNPNFDINKYYQDTFAQARNIAGEHRGRNYGERITYGENNFRGLCGVGTISAAGALLNDRRFAQPLGGNANSLSQGNKYLQNTGYYKEGRGVEDPRMLQDKGYLNSLPIGTVISATGGRRGLGHVQIKVGPNKWVSDADQGGRVLTNGYGNFTVHEPNEAAVKKMNPDLIARDPGTMEWMKRNNIEFKPPTPREVEQGVPGAPPSPEQREQFQQQQQQAAQQQQQQQAPKRAEMQRGREGTQTPQVTQAPTPPQPAAAPREQAPQPKPEGGQQGTATAIPTAATAPPAPTPKEGTKEGSVEAQAFALGGETEAQGPLTAYAIDKDRMRRDDTIVTDGRVRFTMNSEKESMKYDPDTGQVKIDQARGEARQKINANDLQPVEKQQEQSPTPQQEQQVIQNQATQVQSAPQQLPNSYDTTLDLTSDIFKTSSFKRAVAQSRFMKDNDPLGGHYDFGAYNIT